MATRDFLKYSDKICVLDYGGQYAHLITRRIRDIGVYCELKDGNTKSTELNEYKGIILSGGPSSIYEKGAPTVDKKIFDLGIPILGICYGHQIIAHILGGKVIPGKTKEYGFTNIEIKKKREIFDGLEDSEIVWMSHGDLVETVPNGFDIYADSRNCPVTAMGDNKKKIYGIQFHSEVTHTKKGNKIFENFIDICNCKKDWSIKNYVDLISDNIRENVEDKNVFMLLSGGVDSTVAFVLLNKVLGKEKVYGLHIDNGFMRKDESKYVKESLSKLGYDNFHVIDASSEFVEALKEVYEPEEKRNIIGNKFLDVQKRELKKIGLDPKKWILGQGTIYPDTIESKGTKNSHLIKTHHNRVPEILELIKQGRIVEPLEYLYKDEVRAVGKELGIPSELIDRHPFPGPGLSIRCLAAKEDANPKELDKINEKIRQTIPDKFSFKVLPIKSVGVQGDGRSYKNCVCIFEKGQSTKEELNKVSTEIINKVHELNRVLYLVHPNVVDEVHIKKSYVTKNRLDLLREVDSYVNNIIRESGEYKTIWQFPVVILPIGNKHNESIVLRPIESSEAMTASFVLLNKDSEKKIVEEIKRLDIDYVMYDITNKPPGTIEWE